MTMQPRAPIVALNIGQEDSARVADILWEDYGICVRAGAHCAPLMHKALGTAEQGVVRFSFSHFNTEQEVQQAAQSLAGKVDAIYIPIDSTVQSAMAQVVEAANAAGIPVYGSDPVMVKSGALACVSVSNTQLGERSAEMAYDILNGKDVSEVPAEARCRRTAR